MEIPATLTPLLDQIAALAKDRGESLFIVGGFVRDLLLGQADINADVDLVVEGDAIALAEALVKRHGGRMSHYAPFGTATWFPVGAPLPFVDIASARVEEYPQPAVLPTVRTLSGPGSLERDLARRDFTINAMALRVTEPRGAVIDPHGGAADLKAGLVRVLHDQSFIDDPTRIFRAARFAGRLNFTVDRHTESLIGPAQRYIHALSGERVFHEFDLLLREAEPERALRLLQNWETLRFVEPGLEFDEHLSSLFTKTRNSFKDREPYLVYWAVLAYALPDPERWIARLGLERTLADHVRQGAALRELFARLAPLTKPSAIVQSIERVLKPPLDGALMAGELLSADETIRDSLRKYRETWRNVKPVTDGHTLIEMGLPRGPLFGKLLTRLRDSLLDGEITDPGQERAALEEWLAE